MPPLRSHARLSCKFFLPRCVPPQSQSLLFWNIWQVPEQGGRDKQTASKTGRFQSFFPRLQHSARPWISPDCKTTQIPARQMGLPCHEVPWQLLFDISPPRGSGPDLKTTLAGTGAFNRAFMSIWRLVCIVMPWQLTYLPEAVSTLRWFGDLLKKNICRVTKSRSV